MVDRVEGCHAEMGLVADVGKIALLRANAIGDFIFTLPALAAIRAAYPTAEIVLLGQPWHCAFLRSRPSPVDRVEPVPIFRGVYDLAGKEPDPEQHAEFFERMRQEHFDLAVQVHGGGRNSNPFLLRLGARVSAGLRTPDAAVLDRWVPYLYFQREVLRLLEVAQLVGAPPVTTEPCIATTRADLDESCRLVPEIEKPLVVLHPGASDPERRWPADRFAEVGDALAAAGACIVVTGTAAERSLVRSVVSGMQRGALDMAGKLSLGGLTGLLARSRLTISNDTGPLHLAAAVGARTIGLYWCFNYINAGPMSQARHRPAISWRVACPVCGCDRSRTSCDHHDSFVADISADEVITSALDWLAEP